MVSINDKDASLNEPKTDGTASVVGLGVADAELVICIANRPMIDDYPQLDHLRPLAAGELDHIVAHTSNHWRKVFNVFAKFLYSLANERMRAFSDWQSYRDQQLLQLGAKEALCFSAPESFSSGRGRAGQTVFVIAGKTYATQLKVSGLVWLDAYFAVHPTEPIVVSPYLDYRQLSNARIDQLVGLVKQIRARSLPESESSPEPDLELRW
ncbi:MAG: DUF6942 family protein [Cellvibrionaceae bacterium]